MKIPLTKYGWPQVVIFPAIVLASITLVPLTGTAFLPLWVLICIETGLVVILVWVLSFFRDPNRLSPADKNLLLAPADGKITDIEIVQEKDFIGEPAVRIGIFLSIFDAHINRAPCDVKVERITYKNGRHRNAAQPQSGRVNESNELCLVRTVSPNDKLIVRQISGAIARRIVCETKAGEKLAGGQKFGMIKFGSRTELYLPARENLRLLVQVGVKVKAGLTPVAEYI